jgi:two-component system chemotaxis response regulator CheB
MEVLSAGALDVVEKPSILPNQHWDTLTNALTEKVKVLSRVRVITHVQGTIRPPSTGSRVRAATQPIDVVGIGVSTGGPRVLSEICSALPRDFSLGAVVVQHIARGFMKGLVGWLQPLCKIELRIAHQGDKILPGRVLFAPESAHLVVSPERTVHLSYSPPIHGHRPSADVTFKSLAEVYGPRALGILLTGMGADGAEGLRAIHDVAGVTMVQSEETCTVFGMPRAAIERGAAQRILSPAELAESLVEFHRFRARHPSK